MICFLSVSRVMRIIDLPFKIKVCGKAAVADSSHTPVYIYIYIYCQGFHGIFVIFCRIHEENGQNKAKRKRILWNRAEFTENAWIFSKTIGNKMIFNRICVILLEFA